jgi:crotonobetainyl-CoA:carnitine CoA-transferase CaiB-like acyl-CoA transferase
MEWFEDLLANGVACGPINSVDEGVAFAEKVGLDPVVLAGDGAHAMPSIRNPITFSATPARYDLPPPEHDEHGPELRAWLAAPRDESRRSR